MFRIKAVAWKEYLHIIRDKRTLVMIILMPLIQLVLYGYAINTDVKHMATAVYDEDQTYFSRRLIEAFRESAYFDIDERIQSPEAMRRLLDRGKVVVGLHIPPNFTKDVLAGRSADLQLVIDGTDSNPANAALNTSRAVVAAFLEKEGLVPVEVVPINFKPRMWYNPDLKSSFFMVPGVVGFLLQLLIPMITASAVVREKERGNIEQLLVTPLKPYELMIGKLIPYLVIGSVIGITIIGAAHFLFQIPVRGNPITLFVLTQLFLLVCLGIGLFASTVAQNQQQAIQVVMFIAPPSFLLSGFFFPRETMPLPIYYLSEFIPLTYYLKIVRGIVLKGLGYAALWDQTWPLLLMAIVILTVSIKKFHKRLS